MKQPLISREEILAALYENRRQLYRSVTFPVRVQ
jgi:hypothetical protein